MSTDADLFKRTRFPSIGQFRDAVRAVRESHELSGIASLPTLRYRGTVKLHGTNAGVMMRNGELVALSRTREVTPENDNMGFASFVKSKEEAFRNLFSNIQSKGAGVDGEGPSCILFGEWCGKGVNKGCGIHSLEKMFVIFAIRTENDGWLPQLVSGEEENNIFAINQFPMYQIDIDFQEPEKSQEALREATTAVEKECPIANYFGTSGIGEGIVWTPAVACSVSNFGTSKYGNGTFQTDVRDDMGGWRAIRWDDPLHRHGRQTNLTWNPIHVEFSDPQFWFKVKGEKHSITKVKTLAAVDPEVLKGIDDFTDSVVTEARLLQGIDHLQSEGLEADRKATGPFLDWVMRDVLKEETDTLDASSLTAKQVAPKVKQKAREWFFERIQRNS